MSQNEEKSPLGISPKGRRYSAFIIDDSSTVRSMLRSILLSEKFYIAGEAENGKAAVLQLRLLPDKPDYIFSDIDMPEMNGIEAVKMLRPIMNVSNIIMCSSCSDKGKIMDLLKMGVKGYIQKPFDKNKILYYLADIVKKYPKD